MSRLRSTLLASLLCPLFCTGQLLALASDVSDRPAKAGGSENKTVEITSTQSHQEAIDSTVAKTPPTPPSDASDSSRNALDAVGDSLGGTVNGLMRFLGGAVNGVGKAVGGTVGGVAKAVGGTVDGVGKSVGGTVDGLGQFLGDTGEVVLEVAEVTADIAVVAGVLFLYMMADSHCYYGHGYHH